MSQDQDLNRNEAATPFKLQKARQQGQVVKSLDLVSALILGSAAALFQATAWSRTQALLRHCQGLLARIGDGSRTGWSSDKLLVDALVMVAQDALWLMAPAWGLLVITSILAHGIQGSIVWTWEPLKPDWQRLHPLQTMKRIFQWKLFVDAFKALVKIALISGIVGHCLVEMGPSLARLSLLGVNAQLHTLVVDLGVIALQVAFGLFVMSFLDISYVWRAFAKKMQMSRREIQDEHKHREGDPRIRQRLKDIRRDMARRIQSIGKTASADFIVTNPTHVAVALCYRQGEMSAPVVVSKGIGPFAALIRVIAGRHQIPILRSPQLARDLYKHAHVDNPIPSLLYPGVARLLVWVMNQQSLRDAGRLSPA